MNLLQPMTLGPFDPPRDRVARRIDLKAEDRFDEHRDRRDSAPADEFGRAETHRLIRGDVFLDRFFAIEDFELGGVVLLREAAGFIAPVACDQRLLDGSLAGWPDRAAPVLSAAFWPAGVADAVGRQAWDTVATIERRG